MKHTEEPHLYYNVKKDENGNKEILGYAYGEPWVAEALAMGKIRFNTPEEAKSWWSKLVVSKN